MWEFLHGLVYSCREFTTLCPSLARVFYEEWSKCDHFRLYLNTQTVDAQFTHQFILPIRTGRSKGYLGNRSKVNWDKQCVSPAYTWGSQGSQRRRWAPRPCPYMAHAPNFALILFLYRSKESSSCWYKVKKMLKIYLPPHFPNRWRWGAVCHLKENERWMKWNT